MKSLNLFKRLKQYTVLRHEMSRYDGLAKCQTTETLLYLFFFSPERKENCKVEYLSACCSLYNISDCARVSFSLLYVQVSLESKRTETRLMWKGVIRVFYTRRNNNNGKYNRVSTG